MGAECTILLVLFIFTLCCGGGYAIFAWTVNNHPSWCTFLLARRDADYDAVRLDDEDGGDEEDTRDLMREDV
jgi:hypothetical protein